VLPDESQEQCCVNVIFTGPLTFAAACCGMSGQRTAV
jgi:hypothetical protein